MSFKRSVSIHHIITGKMNSSVYDLSTVCLLPCLFLWGEEDCPSLPGLECSFLICQNLVLQNSKCAPKRKSFLFRIP